jgi:hypothetical protein
VGERWRRNLMSGIVMYRTSDLEEGMAALIATGFDHRTAGNGTIGIGHIASQRSGFHSGRNASFA